jgi:hypothetical protein
VLLTYLRLLGPAGPGEVAKYLGTTATEMKKVWPATALDEVRVDGRRAWLPSAAVTALADASAMPGVRFVPPMDALLQARDRDVLVPDRASRSRCGARARQAAEAVVSFG